MILSLNSIVVQLLKLESMYMLVFSLVLFCFFFFQFNMNKKLCR